MKKFYLCFLALSLTVGMYTNHTAAAPAVSAHAAVLMEAESGEVLLNENAHERLPMASTTKIMTALVALRYGDLKMEVTVSPVAVGIEGSSVYLKAGECLTMEQLLYALLLESANDAAAAIAIAVAGDIPTFASLMNETAAEIGLTESHFTNPHGLNEAEHYTTAYDLALLARYALRNEAFVKIVSTYKTTIPLNGSEGTRVLVNHNKLLKSYEGAMGVKTGYTRASGRCLVSAAERDGVTMIAVTLSAPDDWRDHAAMLDYGFSLYTSVSLLSADEYTCALPCLFGTMETVTVSNREEVTAVLPVDHGKITMKAEIRRPLAAPLEANEEIGLLSFVCDGKTVATTPLYTDHAVPCVPREPSLFERFKAFFIR